MMRTILQQFKVLIVKFGSDCAADEGERVLLFLTVRLGLLQLARIQQVAAKPSSLLYHVLHLLLLHNYLLNLVAEYGLSHGKLAILVRQQLHDNNRTVARVVVPHLVLVSKSMQMRHRRVVSEHKKDG